MTADPLLTPLASLLNRQLTRSSLAAQAATELDDRVLAIRLRNTGLTLYLHVQGEQLQLSRNFDREPDAILETTPLGLADMAQGRTAPGKVSMTGDPVVAQQFEQLLRHTRPDWEEELSSIVGDVAAHHIGNSVRGVFAFGEQAIRSMGLDTAEFLSEESRDVAADAEVQGFNREVGIVAQQANELQQRIEALLKRIET